MGKKKDKTPREEKIKGKRLLFLQNELPAYSTSILKGYKKDALAGIQRRYFKRFPIDLDESIEPLDEDLEAVDDDAAGEDTAMPDELLEPEAYATALEVERKRGIATAAKKKQITRWLSSRRQKQLSADPLTTATPDDENPFNTLLNSLTGISAKKPRAKTALKIWRTQEGNTDTIEAETRRRLGPIQSGIDARSVLLPMREKVAADLFGALDEDVRESHRLAALAQTKEELAQWDLARKEGPSKAPDDRQRCILALTSVMQPLLDRLSASTGWCVSLVAGGPEPAFGGELNTISIHSGVTAGDLPLTFGQIGREEWLQSLLPLWSVFLRKVYSPQECRSRAVAPESKYAGLYVQTHDFNGNVNGSQSTSSRTDVAQLPGPAVSKPPTQPSFEGLLPIPSDSETDGEGTGFSTSLNVVPVPEMLVPPKIPSQLEQQPSLTEKESHMVATHLSNIRLAMDRDREHQERTTLSASPIIDPWNHTLPPETQPASPTQTPPPVNRRSISASPRLPISPMKSPIAPSSVPPSSRSSIPPSPTSPDAPSRSSVPQPHTPQPTRTPQPTSAHVEKRIAKAAAVTSPRNSRPARATKRPLPVDEQLALRYGQASSSKRIRASPVPQQSAPSTPPDAAWLLNMLAMFNNDHLGSEWSVLLSYWQAFEKKAGAAKTKSLLKAKNRPVIVTQWVAAGRPVSRKHEIRSAVAYGTVHLQWWASLQPAWRLSAAGKVDAAALDGDLSDLHKPGLNGLLSIVASLYFWGVSAKEQGKDKPRWKKSVLEFSSILQHFL